MRTISLAVERRKDQGKWARKPRKRSGCEWTEAEKQHTGGSNQHSRAWRTCLSGTWLSELYHAANLLWFAAFFGGATVSKTVHSEASGSSPSQSTCSWVRLRWRLSVYSSYCTWGRGNDFNKQSRRQNLACNDGINCLLRLITTV